MKPQRKFQLEDLTEMMFDNGGYCIACGCEHYGIEPDASNYTCEECEARAVFGAEQIILMGLVE